MEYLVKCYIYVTTRGYNKGVKKYFARLIYIHLLVQLPPKTLQMLMSLLFYDVKLKNPDYPSLQAFLDIFDHFWTFLDPRILTPPVDTLFLITRLP
jgi:hypothetical protein